MQSTHPALVNHHLVRKLCDMLQLGMIEHPCLFTSAWPPCEHIGLQTLLRSRCAGKHQAEKTRKTTCANETSYPAR